MTVNYLVKQLLQQAKKYPLIDLESALIQEFLNSYNIKKVKNLLVSTILNRENDSIVKVRNWLKQEGIKINFDLLQKFYELRVRKVDRKFDGAYYTPKNIVAYIIKKTIKNRGTVCDPACGSGAFLLESAKRLQELTNLSYKEIYSKQIFGVDIVPINAHKTTLMLSLFAVLNKEDEKQFRFNIFTGDSLIFDWKKKIKNFKGFDYVVGNPPYVRTKNLRENIRNNLRRWKTGQFGNPDLYIPFFEIGTSIASKNGRVGYITPNTYLTSVNARILRNILKNNSFVEEIIDFNGLQVFKGATTYTSITILNLEGSPRIKFSSVNNYKDLQKLGKLPFIYINPSKLGDDEWRLLPPKVAKNIEKIEKAGIPLYKYAKKLMTGIATLNNNLFLIQDNGKREFKKTFKGAKYFIERSITKKIVKPNKVKNEIALKNNKERIIYPYKKKNGDVQLIPEKTIKLKYPKTYHYLKAIKSELKKRDKGSKKYPAWYAYGRTQGLDCFGKKIIFPMMGNRPSFILVNDENTLIYCGYAIFARNKSDYRLLTKILNSDIMWYYLKHPSKNYSGGFKSFAKNYIKNFSIPSFTKKEITTLEKLKEPKNISRFLIRKYGISNLSL